MLITKGYKTELKPNGKQRTCLSQHAGAARFAYNWALDRIQKGISKPNGIQLHKEWNVWKKENIIWWKEVSKCSPQEALRNLDTAFNNFFRKCKQKVKGKKGFPKFKSKKNGLGSFKLTGTIKVSNTHIQLPRLGKIKLKEFGYLPVNAKILSANVSERAGKWFVSIQVEEEINKIQKPEAIVGVDLGIKTLAVCSDGTTFDNPNALKSNLDRLKRRSKQLSKKQKGSKNRKKAAKKLAKLHYRIANIRKDSLHKITSYLTKTKSKVAIEDLNVSGMLKNRKLSRSIQDIGLFEFRRQLEYKGKWYGCEIIIADRFFPSSKSCSNCGWIKRDLNLKDRVFECDSCGLEIDRDLNASYNLESYTVSSTGINAYGEVSSGLK
ncbi:MAG: transposase [Neisseriaceae bacterium]|nr:MAG: transposase [Neisseriaceae bacterium]